MECGKMQRHYIKSKICLALDNDVIEKSEFWADYDNRSVSSYINISLKEFFSMCPDLEEIYSRRDKKEWR